MSACIDTNGVTISKSHNPVETFAPWSFGATAVTQIGHDATAALLLALIGYSTVVWSGLTLTVGAAPIPGGRKGNRKVIGALKPSSRVTLTRNFIRPP